MEIATEPVYDPTADVDNQFGDGIPTIAEEAPKTEPNSETTGTADANLSSDNLIIAQETTDTFDNASQLPPKEYYKQQVDELYQRGALEEYNQQAVGQATLDYIAASNKDPVSLLNIYCTVSGQPAFQFFDYQMEPRPGKKFGKFIMVSELDGVPVFGALQPSKKDAKKACAVRIIEQLLLKERLNCLNDVGRKIKHPDKHPRPFAKVPQIQPLFPQNAQPLEGQHLDDELARLNTNYYQQQQYAPPDPQMAFFAEDIDFGGGAGIAQPQQQAIMPMPTPRERAMFADFERANPVPPDCKDVTAFHYARDQTFLLFCQNAFWRDFSTDMTPEVQEKLNQCGMWSENWNPLHFVNKCIMIANSWRTGDESEEQSAMEQSQQQETNLDAAATAAAPMVTNQEQAIEAQQKLQKNLPRYSAAFFVFTLPYIPPRYAGVALFNKKIYHGKLEISKSRAKLSCATAVSIEIVKMGLADMEKKPKPVKKSQAMAKAKKRKMAPKVEEAENDSINESNSDTNTVTEHQFLLTLHPAENLDPRTHFLLATNPNKSAIQLLHEMCGKARYVVGFEEMRQPVFGNLGNFTIIVQMQPPGIPGLPQEVTGQPFSVQGVPERNKKLAKLSAARVALDALVQRKVIGVNEHYLAHFKHAIKRARLCECEENIGNGNGMSVEEDRTKQNGITNEEKKEEQAEQQEVNQVETAVNSLELAEAETQAAVNAPLMDNESV